MVIYSEDGLRTSTVQAKALSARAPVPLGTHLDHLMAKHVVVCRRAQTDKSESFILAPEKVRRLVHKGVKNGNHSHWLQPRAYEAEKSKEAWHRIGEGFA